MSDEERELYQQKYQQILEYGIQHNMGCGLAEAARTALARISALTAERDSAQALLRDAVEVLEKSVVRGCECDECAPIDAFLDRPEVVKIGGGK